MIVSLVFWIVLGAVAGWLASMIMSTDEEQGALGNIVIGICGALVGGFISSALGGSGVTGFNLTSVVVATLGAVVLLFFMRMLRVGATKH